MAQRRLLHRNEYDAFKVQAKRHRDISSTLSTNLGVISSARKRNEGKIEAAKQAIAKAEEENAKMSEAEEGYGREYGPGDEAWKDDQEKVKEWQAFLTLESDQKP